MRELGCYALQLIGVELKIRLFSCDRADGCLPRLFSIFPIRTSSGQVGEISPRTSLLLIMFQDDQIVVRFVNCPPSP